MPILDTGFEWGVCADGYEIVMPVPSAGPHTTDGQFFTAGMDFLRPKSDKYRVIRPLARDDHAQVYVAFSKLDPRKHDSIIGFANQWGLLGHPSPEWLRGRSAWEHQEEQKRWRGDEHVGKWKTEILKMRRFVAMAADGMLAGSPDVYRGRRLAMLDVSLVQGETMDQIRIKHTPRTFLDALYLQFAQAVVDGGGLRACAHCGKPLELGGRQRRRADTRFCDTKCRNDFNNARRRTEALIEKASIRAPAPDAPKSKRQPGGKRT